jgi:hypothetical protein
MKARGTQFKVTVGMFGSFKGCVIYVFIMTACNLTAMAFERKPNPTERQRVNNLQTCKENI